ncbi:hypothetical protein O0L34_g14682 [Tuta absoluta]|nr:hypothetical protein O0L34_g14682 [Tuta absoluta]
MADIKEEIKKTLYQRCKCCLETEQLIDMWEPYQCNGEIEVYGEMLKECYDFPWMKSGQHYEYICDQCIERLKSSLSFRRDILAAQEVLDKLIEDQTKNQMIEMKLEAMEADVKPVRETLKLENVEQMDTEDEENFEESICDEEQTEFLEEGDDEEHQDPEVEIEFLEEDEEEEAATSTTTKRKWPKKKKKSERIKTYKQYTHSDMEQAVEAVLNNKLSRSEAADKYSVPVKTLGFKVRQREMDDSADSESKKKQQQFFDEIRKILDYTNATPFKTKIGRLFCAYCSTDGPTFEYAGDLRAHTRNEHKEKRLRDVEVFMRPYYLNEILKLDIGNLHCTVCVEPLKGWNEMFEHLKEHSVELDLAYTRVIPFVLGEEVICCLCKSVFPHFHMLDSHMNSHYVNYVCGDCGDTFLSESRFKKHVETHNTSTFPCSECGKVFHLEKYRTKHFKGVHLKTRRFPCKYCSDSFSQEYTRHQHVVAKHNEKIKKIACEHCDQTFTWRPYYLKHVLKNHTTVEKRFKCKKCDKTFYQRNELKNHEDWHTGKGFTCMICNRKFSSKNYLQKHSNAAHCGETVVFVMND